MGEGMGNDHLIMPFITSANIACGYHAGDVETMWQTVELAVKHGVAVGAHVSFMDKENFGRRNMDLPVEDIYELVEQQLLILQEISSSLETEIKHVKPHGALYNLSAADKKIATAIAHAVKDFDHEFVLVGLSGSFSIEAAASIGLKTASETFADRTYQDDGSLTPRSAPNALITSPAEMIKQVLQMINTGTVTTVSGKTLPVVADTICIHGDGEQAVEFAKAIYAIMNPQ
jgi:UPF0271 protein